MKQLGFFLISIVSIWLLGCAGEDTNNNSVDGNVTSAPLINFTVAATYPHDTSSFIQGLAFHDGKLYEGTGLEKKSKLMQVDLTTGKPVKEVTLDTSLFGEGVTILNDTIYQLTWQNKVVLVYSAKDMKKIKEFPINTDGWGITHDGKNLIVSDGSSNLYFYEPSTFRLLRTQGVTENGNPVINLNELEFINGFVYANQWQYPYIVKIDPNSGQVVGKLDLTPVIQRLQSKDPSVNEARGAVLNGIAYNPQTKKIYITGKDWPELYEIQFEH